MASIQERKDRKGNVTYRVQIRLRQHPPQFATFERKTDAKRWAQEMESAIREGRYFGTHESQRRTLSELVDRYVEKLPSRKLKSAKVVTQQLKWWKEQIGDRSLVDVTPALISEQKDKLAKEGPGGHACGPASVNRYLAALSSAFSAAVKEWQWLEESPLRRVRKLPEPRGRMRFLSEDERTRLLKVCQESSNPYLYTVVVLALSTGMRRGEIMNLNWEDVDIYDGRIVLKDTKNGEQRVVPVAGLARDLLERLARVRQIDSEFR